MLFIHTIYSDTSGMTIYLTPNLREHDLAYFNSGPKDLVIPPMTESFVKQGICTGKCTAESLGHPIFITSSHLHMHYLGKQCIIIMYHISTIIYIFLFQEGVECFTCSNACDQRHCCGGVHAFMLAFMYVCVRACFRARVCA